MQNIKTADRSTIFRRLRQGSFWIASGRVLAMIIVFANLVLLAKLLPTEDFSAYVVTISLVTLASVGAMFGLNSLICKLVSAYLGVLDGANATRSVLIVSAIGLSTSLIVAVAVSLGCLFFGEAWFSRPMISEMAFWVGLWILLLASSQIVAEIFRGLHNLFAAGLLAGISGGLFANAIFLAGMLVAHFAGELNYPTIVKLGALSFVIPIVVSVVWLKMAWPKMSNSAMLHADKSNRIAVTSILAEALPIMLLSFIALGFDRSGQLIAGAFGVDSDVSIFEATWQLAFIPIVPLTILGLSVASTVSELHAQKNTKAMEEILKYASTFSLLLSLPIIWVLSFFGGPILSFIFEPSFSAGASAMVVLCMVQLIRNWMGPCDILLVMTGLQNEAFICFLIAAPVLLLGPWAVDQYGVIGLASVVAIAILVSRVLQYFVVVWKLGVTPHANLNPAFLKQLSLIIKGKLHLS